jgi:hypothetical protein
MANHPRREGLGGGVSLFQNPRLRYLLSLETYQPAENSTYPDGMNEFLRQ